jgi:hypothetical protein
MLKVLPYRKAIVDAFPELRFYAAWTTGLFPLSSQKPFCTHFLIRASKTQLGDAYHHLTIKP